MLTRISTAATKTGRVPAAALGVLLCAAAQATAAAADSADVLPAGAALFGYFREARDSAPVPAQRTVNFNEIRRLAGDPAYLTFAGGQSQPASPAGFHYAIVSDLGLSSDRASQAEPGVLLRNSDAFVRANVRLTPGKKWLGFVYADMGAADSALRWQGLVGVHGSQGLDLFGGWRRVTYHFTPGMGFDSLDFNGPFFGATLAW